MEEEYSNEQKPDKKTNKPSKAWYLVPLLFGLLGGIVGYLAVKDDDKKMAKSLLIAGIIISFIPVFLVGGSVLAYYGIYAPSGFIGSTARGFGQVQVSSPWALAASNGQINLNLANRAGQDIVVDGIDYTIDSMDMSCGVNIPIEYEEKSLVSCTPTEGWTSQNIGDEYTATVTIYYRIPSLETNEEYSVTGTVTGMYS